MKLQWFNLDPEHVVIRPLLANSIAGDRILDAPATKCFHGALVAVAKDVADEEWSTARQAVLTAFYLMPAPAGEAAATL